MFVHQIEEAIAAASPSAFPALNRAIWSGLSTGVLSDDDAQRLAELIHARQTVAKAASAPVSGFVRPNALFPPRKVQRPPVRAVAIERRRRLAASGPMPPALACRFTVGELAVLRVVADQCRDHGKCTLAVDGIAARAGVGRTTCQRAIREAARLGMLHVEERRQYGAKNLTNRLSITDREWRAWIERGATEKGGGFGKQNRTNRISLPEERKAASDEASHAPASRFARSRRRATGGNEKAPRGAQGIVRDDERYVRR